MPDFISETTMTRGAYPVLAGVWLAVVWLAGVWLAGAGELLVEACELFVESNIAPLSIDPIVFGAT